METTKMTIFTQSPETTLVIRKPNTGFDGLTTFAIGLGFAALAAIGFASIAEMFNVFAF